MHTAKRASATLSKQRLANHRSQKRRNPVRATIPAAPAAVAQLNAGEPLAARFTRRRQAPFAAPRPTATGFQLPPEIGQTLLRARNSR